MRFLPPAALVLLMGLALTACSGHRERAARADAFAGADWRSIATQADRDRLRRWRKAWIEGLGRARAADARGIEQQGLLFDPDRAIPGAIPPPGNYRCRTFKLGALGTAMAEFTSYPDARCRVIDEGAVSRFAKISGPQRPTGTIFPGDSLRATFLGTLTLGDETAQMGYGRDATRDIVGIVERVEQGRWRVVLPYPHYESVIDVIELVPDPQ